MTQTISGTTGLSWFCDDENRAIKEDVSLAIAVYRRRLSGSPNAMQVNEEEFNNGNYDKLKNITIYPRQDMLHRHFLIFDKSS